METGNYTLRVTVTAAPAEADTMVRAALKDQGFGILSEIDVQAALLDKLGEDIGYYTILGACNPPLAHRAIGKDNDIGALLPCNVVLRAAGEGTEIVAADPIKMLELAGGEGIDEIGREAREGIEAALKSLAG